MAAPTISTLSPVRGKTGGRDYVVITGTDFRLTPDPPATGPTSGTLQRTVRVAFGSSLATDVRVTGATRLSCLTPIHDPGIVDVTVTNLDDDGVAIPDEAVTAEDAYTFYIPSLLVETDFTRLVRTVLREIKRQVLPNTSLTVHTDYSLGRTAGVTEVASLPAIVLYGPEVNENRFFGVCMDYKAVDIGGGRFQLRKPAYTVDLIFDITGISDHDWELLNMQSELIKFFHRNKYLIMDRDPSDASKGVVAYEMDFDPNTEPDVTGKPNESNIRSFTGKFVIKGFDLEDLADVANDLVAGETSSADTVSTQTQLKP